jgi:hypothetical protein
MEYNHTLSEIVDKIDILLEETGFVNELAGEDETFLDTVRDFFVRLEDQFTITEYVEEDPLLWRTQQDAETD